MAAVAVVVEVAEVAGGAAALPVLAEDVEGGGLRPGREHGRRACPQAGRRRGSSRSVAGFQTVLAAVTGAHRPRSARASGTGGGAGGSRQGRRGGGQGGVSGEGCEDRVGGDGGDVGEARGGGGGEVIERDFGRILDHRHHGPGGVEAGDTRVGGEITVEEGGGAGDVPGGGRRRGAADFGGHRGHCEEGGRRRSGAGVSGAGAMAAGSGRAGGAVSAAAAAPGARRSRDRTTRGQDAGTRRVPVLPSGGVSFVLRMG